MTKNSEAGGSGRTMRIFGRRECRAGCKIQMVISGCQGAARVTCRPSMEISPSSRIFFSSRIMALRSVLM